MTEININLPGWRQTVDEPERKEFLSDDGHRFVLNTQGSSIDISVEETESGKPVMTDGGEEAIKSKTIRLGDSGVTEIEYSDADGDGFREEVEIGPGDALVVTDPSGFTLTVHGPPEESEGESDG